MNVEMTNEEIEKRYKDLEERRQSSIQNKMKIEAVLESLKRELRSLMEEVKAAGYDPDNLPEEVKKAKEVLITKMQILSSDLDHVESVMKPMLEIIK